MNPSTLRIATRKSALALWQAEHVAALLRAAHPGLAVALVPMSTRGDEILDQPLASIGGKGLFLKELEVAMLEGRAELAVHSLKDVPAELEPGFVLPAILPRADAADAFVSNHYADLAALPHGARVGTSSLRRQAQLRALRPDLVLLDLMMPMISGYEVCEQIKANPLTKNIPVLCISSAHTPEARAQCFRAGAAELLKKPFFPAELVAQIGRHLKASDDLL